MAFRTRLSATSRQGQERAGKKTGRGMSLGRFKATNFIEAELAADDKWKFRPRVLCSGVSREECVMRGGGAGGKVR